MTRVDRGYHHSVRNNTKIKDIHTFHEKRPLFTVKYRITLVDFHLERIAFYLAEIRV